MNFSTIQSTVRTRLYESAASFWTDADIQQSINDGYQEMSDASEWYEKSTTLTTYANQIYYQTFGGIAPDMLSAKACQNPTTKFWLQGRDILYLDVEVHPRWENIQSQPEYMFMRGLFTIGFAPKRNIDGTLTFFYSAMPANLSAGTDVPGFPQEYHYGLVEYALYDLFCQDGETEKALLHWKQYQQYEQKLMDFVGGRIRSARMETMKRG